VALAALDRKIEPKIMPRPARTRTPDLPVPGGHPPGAAAGVPCAMLHGKGTSRPWFQT
jgi:hypothetical protein